MEARAKILGHPVHQMLIVLPLGLLMGAVIFDVIHLATDDTEWSAVAYRLIPAGILTIVNQLFISENGLKQALLGMVTAVVPMVPEGLVRSTTIAFAVVDVRRGQR